MKRRDAIKMISIGMGYTLSASTLATMASSCKTAPSITWVPSFFSPLQGRLMEDLLEIMLPATSTPGAKDVGLAPLIDQIVKDCYEAKDQEHFRLGMESFFGQLGDEAAQDKASTAKLTLLLEKHLTKMTPEFQAAINELLSSEELPKLAGDKDLYLRFSFIKNLRTLALSGYFSSEEVATKHLNYMPVPGPYQGCIPASDVGSTWAL